MNLLRGSDTYLAQGGFESYLFKVSWYNHLVAETFQLHYPDDTVAMLVLSTPSMFERIFIPSVKKQAPHDQCRDPLDACVSTYIEHIKKMFPDEKMDVIYDYDLGPGYKPKILVQTAGHVAGAAYFYQKSHVTNPPWPEKQKIHGVSIHPRYGGWFAFRAVIVLQEHQDPSLQQKDPPDIISDNTRRITLLDEYNFHWQNGKFRDIIDTVERYSSIQKLYFDTMPKHRGVVIDQILASSTDEQVQHVNG